MAMARANNAETFRVPNNTERTMIFGDTGSGKTQFGAWLLSRQDLKHHVWVITDYKGDDLLNSLERTRDIDYGEVPKKPGLYILHARPDEDEQMEAWLWKVWDQEYTGLFIDEGAMIPNARGKGAMATLQIQGRSKRTPIITLSQRSVDISRYTVSQSSHIVLLFQNDDRELDVVRSMTPDDFPTWLPREFSATGRLPDYYARWYTVRTRQRYVLRPVPSADKIRSAIDAQLEPKLRFV
jgi:hypothetical protein